MPNKESIYPEFMPRAYNRVGPTSRLDQFLAYMKAHSTVAILDIRDSMRRARDRELLFDLTDSHWNERGSWVAYERIIGVLAGWFPGMQALPRGEFREVVRTIPGGDLARMLGVPELMPEEHLGLQRLSPNRSRKTDEFFPPRPGSAAYRVHFAMEQDDRSLPRAVVFRDSFLSSIIPILSEHFSRVVYIWDYEFDHGLVERERPAVVIQEMVERSLMGPLPVDF